ncbi:uncharacterized protein WCC33_000809 [Rhinophrynus dorsalis]
MEETDSLQRDMKQRGKFLSLDKQEAKRVLEIYIRRSLSNCEEKTKGYQRTAKRHKRVERSASDFCKPGKFTVRAKEKKLSLQKKAEEDKVDEQDLGNVKTPDISEGAGAVVKPLSTDTAKGSPGVKKPSWFKNFLGLLFKKKEDKKENNHLQCLETNISTASGLTDNPVASSTEGLFRQSSRRSSFKKSSIRRAFSVKKTTMEEVKERNAEASSGYNIKLKRPTVLPLQHKCRPLSIKAGKNKDCYYNKVSAEIELIVKESDKIEYERKQSLGGELNPDGDPDALIKKIVSILSKQGDMWDKKIKEDPTLNTFFRDISYNSFKQLADVYVDKEVKCKEAMDVTTEDIKFAYSIHFTAQVAGVSSHPVNRIMGFGNQYLQDTFTCFSYNKRKDWDKSIDLERCISPD